MSYELSEIKKIRKQLGLTQTDLAKRSGVSQSLIAKIEAGNIDPTFSKTKKIFATLADLEKKGGVKAFQLVNKKIISISSHDSIQLAIKKMKKFDISQMPVVDDHQVVGLISESILLNALIAGKKLSIKEIMEEAPPLVAKNATIDVVSSLLKHYPMVLVSEKGKLLGLITKADLIGSLYRG